jgi:hypothetical protein
LKYVQRQHTGVERKHLEYAATFSLAMLAGSLSYFMSLEQPATFGVLLFVPLLFGFTAYSSRDSFRRASLLAFVSLIFAPLKPGMALVAVAVSLGNPLVSLFAGGANFKDFYGSVTVPMLLVAAVLGAGSFVAFQESPELAEPLENRTVGIVSDQATAAVEDAGLLEQQSRTIRSVISQSSKASVAATRRIVLNSTGNDLSLEDRRRLEAAFGRAREEVPEQVSGRAANLTEQVNLSSRIRGSTERVVKDRPAVLSAGLGALTYALHPLIGLLTAFSASLVRALDPEDS